MKKALRLTLFSAYVLVLACMGGATIVEKYMGTDYVSARVYGAWWFSALWALLVATGVVYLLRRRVRRWSVVALHLSLVVILVGAMVTHVSSSRGTIHLRQGVAVSSYVATDDHGGQTRRELPFSLTLNEFNVKYHEGTTTPADYESRLTVVDGDKRVACRVSMNNVCSYASTRFYQSSYDSDGHGSVLSMNSDPYGIPVTYAGYALLFVSLIWMLVDPKGRYRTLLRRSLSRRGMLSLVVVACCSATMSAAPTLPRETARKLGELSVLYNGRVCPLQTYAIDFTKKLHGGAHYEDYTPEQVLAGFMFYGDEWSAEPLLRLKSGAMRETMQLPRYCSVNTFFNPLMGGYVIGPYVREYYSGRDDAFHKQVADVDDRLMMVMELRRGVPLKVFPVVAHGGVEWFSPTDDASAVVGDSARRAYMRDIFSLMGQEVRAGRYDVVDQILDKMLKYQRVFSGGSLPSATRVKAERIYNAVPFATMLFMLNLSMGVLTLLYAIWAMTSGRGERRLDKCVKRLSVVVMSLSLVALTACLVLRWIIGGSVPMANGYETMLLMAWIIMIVSLLACRRFDVMLSLGFLMSGFFLLVSHVGQMNPGITPVMPVLASPLLSVHVSVIMMSFALLSLTFVCGLVAIIVCLSGGRRGADSAESVAALRLLSELFLYPALATLGMGIFIGAVWANVSWGTYWIWDAKETWALITFMVYAMAVHRQSLPFMRGDMGYHVFMAAAFLTIIMTYFGVNYYLGGMHSYA